MQGDGGRTEHVVAMPQARRGSEPTEFYVYVLVCGEFSKIGKTTNPELRFNQIEPRLPWPVREFILLPCQNRRHMDESEKGFHGIFAEQRSYGEWFKLSDEDLDDIREDARLRRDMLDDQADGFK